MAATGQNFELFQGDYKEVTISVVDENGQAVDLTGYNAVWCMYIQNVDDVVIAITKTTSGGITIPSPTSGELVITLEDVDTENLIPRIYSHQCEIEDLLGRHATVTTGYVKLYKSITHESL